MPTYTPIVPYADLTYANAYFGERMQTAKWDAADDPTKTKALKMGTAMMDNVAYAGFKNVYEQPREFPRNGDTDIRDEVAAACCECALAILNNKTLEQIFNKIGIGSESIGDASTSYVDGGAKELLDQCYGLPSPTAARLLAPWLKDDMTFDLTRTG